MARQILLVRHGAVPAEYTGRYVGSLDIPLSAEGQRQAEHLAGLIQSQSPASCFCSPLLRARQTAERLLPGHAKIQIEEDLREIDFGQWENLSFQEIADRHPQEVQRWTAFDESFTFPGGESLADYHSRIRRFAGRLASDPDEKVLCVAHGGVIRTLICHFLGLAPISYLLFDVHYAALATITLFKEQGVLSGLNAR